MTSKLLSLSATVCDVITRNWICKEAAQKSSEIKKKRGILSNIRTVELEKVAHHRNRAAGIQKERRKGKILTFHDGRLLGSNFACWTIVSLNVIAQQLRD